MQECFKADIKIEDILGKLSYVSTLLIEHRGHKGFELLRLIEGRSIAELKCTVCGRTLEVHSSGEITGEILGKTCRERSQL